jgi:Zn-dependent oligopeptidase
VDRSYKSNGINILPVLVYRFFTRALLVSARTSKRFRDETLGIGGEVGIEAEVREARGKSERRNAVG